MNSTTKVFDVFVFLTAIVLAMPAWAELSSVPQAPVVTYGYIRNEYGTPMTRLQAAVLELVRDDARTGRVYASCDVAGMEMVGLNYRLSLEVDSASGCRENAVVPDTVMFIRATVGGVNKTLAPAATFATPQPGTVQRIDYTTGEDKDGDGMPDVWERWVLRMARRSATDSAVKAFMPGDDSDGDGMTNYQEYLAGTDPFVATDIVMIKSFEPIPGTRRAKVTFSTPCNRTLRIVTAQSLANPAWVPMAASETPDGEFAFGTIKGDGYEKTYYISANANAMFVRLAVN